jgi:hypothetical protein
MDKLLWWPTEMTPVALCRQTPSSPTQLSMLESSRLMGLNCMFNVVASCMLRRTRNIKRLRNHDGFDLKDWSPRVLSDPDDYQAPSVKWPK